MLLGFLQDEKSLCLANYQQGNKGIEHDKEER